MGGPITEEGERMCTNSVPKFEWFWIQKGR